jgi:hypothetical protein
MIILSFSCLFSGSADRQQTHYADQNPGLKPFLRISFSRSLNADWTQTLRGLPSAWDDAFADSSISFGDRDMAGASVETEDLTTLPPDATAV